MLWGHARKNFPAWSLLTLYYKSGCSLHHVTLYSVRFVWKPNVLGEACGCTCGCIVMLRRKLGMLCDPLWRPIRFSWAIIVFCVFNVCTHILYSEYIFYITCYFCVTWLCIAWLVYSFHPTRVHGFETRPPKRPMGVYIVPSPRFCHQVASALAGWRPQGLNILKGGFCLQIIFVM